jgi:hypothetical protein
MPKTILPIAFFAFFSITGFTTIPANAMTSEEFLKMMGVLGRYSDDINRTFRPNNQPNVSPQPNSSSQPNLPQVDAQPTQPNSIPTTDRSLEQFLPRQ